MFFFSILLASSFIAAPAQAELATEWPLDDVKEEALHAPAALKILWWNTGCSVVAQELKNKGFEKENVLVKNLNELAQGENVPGLFIIGEHCPGTLPRAAKNLLKKIYPENLELKKSNPNGSTLNGIWVFSKWPITKVSQKTLDASKNPGTTARTYLLLKISHPDGNFLLSPVHFYNPWREVIKNTPPWSLPGALSAKDDINFAQIEQHMNFLKEDVEFAQEPLIVIGDFNSLKNFWFINMAGYDLFKQNLMDRGPQETTYPTPSAKKLQNDFPDIIIDHVFTTPLVEGTTEVLPLKGSDHFPILFTGQIADPL